MKALRRLIKKLIPRPLFRLVEPYGHLIEALLANLVYKFPAKELKVIGVTGTDGKTTTVTLIHNLLKSAGLSAGMMTTINTDYGKGVQPNTTRMTTVSSFELFKRLRRMRDNEVEWVVLETTSHALAQNRIWGIPYSVAVLTNITHEHLDYHGTLERYRDAKFKLFRLVGNNKKGLRTGVVNADEEAGELFASAVKRPIRYGLKEGDLKASKVQATPAGSSFLAKYGERELDIRLKLPGWFNVYNALAAIGTGLALGLSDKEIEEGIASTEQVEGRMNTVDEGQGFAVIVDYAHTPNSLQKVFETARPFTEGRLIAVFGSSGQRDKEKRPMMGELAANACDVVILTEDDDRGEDGVQIMEEIAAGAERAGKRRNIDLYLIHDRGKAIEAAIVNAEKGDTVLLLGKGHEKSIVSLASGEKRPWDEVAHARSALKKR